MPRTVFNMQASEFDYSPEFNTLFHGIANLTADNNIKLDGLKDQMYSCFTEVFERQQEVGDATQKQIQESLKPLCEKVDKTNEVLEENNKLLKELIQVLSRDPEDNLQPEKSPKHKPSLDTDKGSSEGIDEEDENFNFRPDEFRQNPFIKIQGRGA